MSTTTSRTWMGLASLRRRFLAGAIALSMLVGGAISVGVWAHGMGAGGPHSIMMHGFSNPEQAAEHVQRMVQHVLVELDATAEQRTRLEPLVNQAANDLVALHAQSAGGAERLIGVLSADRIDRAALEALRVDHLRLADQASLRIVQLIGDVADVLTPAQRKALAERIAKHVADHRG